MSIFACCVIHCVEQEANREQAERCGTDVRCPRTDMAMIDTVFEVLYAMRKLLDAAERRESEDTPFLKQWKCVLLESTFRYHL